MEDSGLLQALQEAFDITTSIFKNDDIYAQQSMEGGTEEKSYGKKGRKNEESSQNRAI